MPRLTPEQAESRHRLRLLMTSWGRRSQKIERLRRRAGSFGDSVGLPPRLFRKFAKLMEQISSLSAKERRTISEIKDIERRHHLLRKERKLRRAPAQAPSWEPRPEDEPEAEKPRNRLWLILLWWWLMTRPKLGKD